MEVVEIRCSVGGRIAGAGKKLHRVLRCDSVATAAGESELPNRTGLGGYYRGSTCVNSEALLNFGHGLLGGDFCKAVSDGFGGIISGGDLFHSRSG